jgi:hypothetical protein
VSWPPVIIVGLIAVAVAVVAWGQHRHVAPLLRRPSALPAWRDYAPLASDDAVRTFLVLVVDAFGLRRKHHEVFRPDDRVLDLYRALTPPGWTVGDQGEMEVFGALLRREYRIDLWAVWREDLTFGELFTLARS